MERDNDWKCNGGDPVCIYWRCSALLSVRHAENNSEPHVASWVSEEHTKQDTAVLNATDMLVLRDWTSEKHPLLPTEWAQILVRSTTSLSNTNLKLQSECFGLLFRFQMVLGYLFTDQNGHLTAERGDFFNMSVLFRHTLGKRPFSRVFARPRGKSAHMEKPLAGWAVQERWRGLNLLQLGSDSQMLLQDCDTHFLLLCQRLLYCFKPKWPCCGHVISLPSFHT